MAKNYRKLYKEAGKLLIIKQDSKTDKKLLALIIFSYKVFRFLGLYPS
jgi:hypothetical protein